MQLAKQHNKAGRAGARITKKVNTALAIINHYSLTSHFFTELLAVPKSAFEPLCAKLTKMLLYTYKDTQMNVVYLT